MGTGFPGRPAVPGGPGFSGPAGQSDLSAQTGAPISVDAPVPAGSQALALVQADLSWLEEILRLEAAGFPPEIRESREIFIRRLEVFPRGFLITPGDEEGTPGTGDGAPRSAAGYFYAEVWSGTQGEFSLEHDPAGCIDPHGGVIYLASMTVDPALRGRGLGSRLFSSGMKWMKAAFPRTERAVLMVREDWTGARCIYEAQGFRTTGMRSGILGRHKALIMERDLQGY